MSAFCLQKKFKISENIFYIQKNYLLNYDFTYFTYLKYRKVKFNIEGRRFMYEKVEKTVFKNILISSA